MNQKQQNQLLKRQDKHLILNKLLDGTIKIERQSPYSSQKRFDVLTIQNQFLGSLQWLRRKIMFMDTQRFNLIGQTLRHNKKIRERPDDNRVHDELAELMVSNEKFIN